MIVRSGKRATLAREGTAIVIDGFLRSGNTFSVAAFAISNGRDLHIGRHLHGAPHLLRAARLGIPAIALIREPREAVASYLVRRPTLSADDAVLEYLDFYSTAWRVHESFVVGLFDTVVFDFGAVIAAVNRRFGTSFVAYESSPLNQAAAFALVEEMNRLECRGEVVETHVGRPSAEREDLKAEIRALMEQPSTRSLLRQADDLYDSYVALAARSLGDPRADLQR
jgi:hypothetical protein